jgi:hypothetical protein
MGIRRSLDDALFGPESAARLVATHSALAALIAIRIAVTPFVRFTDLPDDLVDPVPILRLLHGMPAASVIVALQVLGCLAAIAAAVRYKPRATFATAWVCYLLLAGLRASRGKVLHNDLLLLWVAAVFLLAPIVADRRDRTPSRRYGWPVRTATAMIALIYWFAAYEKLRRSGPGWVFGDNMTYVMRWAPIAGEPNAPALTRWVADHGVVAHLSAGGILVLELLFPIVIFWRRVRPWFAAAAVAVHVTTWLLLGLDYWVWAATVPIVLIDWPDLVGRRRRELRPAVTRGPVEPSAASRLEPARMN